MPVPFKLTAHKTGTTTVKNPFRGALASQSAGSIEASPSAGTKKPKIKSGGAKKTLKVGKDCDAKDESSEMTSDTLVAQLLQQALEMGTIGQVG